MRKILVSLWMGGFCSLMATDEANTIERETKRIAGQVEGVVASTADFLAEVPIERETKRIVRQAENKVKKLFGRFK